MDLTRQQQQFASILPRITSFMSLIGSSSIVVDVVQKYRKRGNSNSKPTTYHRLMLGMSFCDIFMSGGLMMTTWPIPADTPDTYTTYGNDATCKTQAFFVQLGIGAPFYTLCLSVYYYLVIVKDSRPNLILERCMHFVCLSFAFGTVIASLALDLFGYAKYFCWFSAEHDLFRWLFWFGPLWAIIAIVAVIMSMIYFDIVKQEKKQRRWKGVNDQGATTVNSNSGGTHNRENRNLRNITPRRSVRVSDSVKSQAFRYVGSFFLTWIFQTIARGMETAGQGDSVPYWLSLVGVTLLPSQGFFNFLIYIRPRYEQHRKRHPEVGKFVTFFRVNPLFAGCNCCHGVLRTIQSQRVWNRSAREGSLSEGGTSNNVANSDSIIDYNSQEEECESEQDSAEAGQVLNDDSSQEDVGR
mmetsp:Transcript_8269/g.14588  ORF Transcript_8269/g.14588 Transcript_8269/m.14588 type:complete len:411 (-) Transcript_8269:221-1453(-)